MNSLNIFTYHNLGENKKQNSLPVPILRSNWMYLLDTADSCPCHTNPNPIPETVTQEIYAFRSLHTKISVSNS